MEEAYHGFSNASPDSAVTTHMWKCDVIGARLYCLSAATHLTCVFAFNRPNNHGQQQSRDRKPQTEQCRPFPNALSGMQCLHQSCC